MKKSIILLAIIALVSGFAFIGCDYGMADTGRGHQAPGFLPPGVGDLFPGLDPCDCDPCDCDDDCTCYDCDDGSDPCDCG